jgi:hypothetical protein
VSDQLQEMSEALAESIATSLWEFNHTLLNTGLSPDELLDCALRVFAREVPAFANVSQESLQLFADSLGVAIANRMLVEHDVAILARSGLRPQ